MREIYSHEFNLYQRMFAVITGMWRINRDSIDFKWGYFSPKFGFEFLINRGFYFDQTYSISLCFGWGKFKINLPFKTRLEEFCDWPSYGFQVVGSSLWIRTGDYEKNQSTRRMITFDFPFFTWLFDWHRLKASDGSWIEGGWRNREKAHIEEHPYTYVLRSGVKQERIANCCIERRQWHRKWAPFLKKTITNIDVKFNDEVGERSGSWKGGTVGCGWNIVDGESIEQALRRMEAERKL